MSTKRGFQGIWIPKEVWLSKDLNLFQKCLYAEIKSLDKDTTDEDGNEVTNWGCRATNAYFAKFFSVTESNIQKNLKVLKNMGLVRYEVDGPVQRVMTTRGVENFLPHGKFSTPRVENFPSSLPIINNKEKKISMTSVTVIYKHWLSKSSFIAHKKLTSGMSKNIIAKLKEESLEDLLKTIDNYALILSDPEKYWFTHKFGLDEFFRPGQQNPSPYLRFSPERFVESNFIRKSSNHTNLKPEEECYEIPQQPKTEREEFEEKFYKYQAKVIEAIPDYTQRDDIPPDNDRDTWYKAWQAVKAEGKRMAYKTIVDIFQRKKNETEEY